MPDHTTRAAIVAGNSEWSIRRTWWHRVKPRIMPSLLTALAVNLFAGLAACLIVTIVHAADNELRDPSYYKDEVYIGQRPRDPQERDKARRQAPHIADQDLNNIAILVDDGTLVISGVTDTDAIAARFYASHADVFDFININVASSFINDVNPEGGFAFEQNISNAVSGINLGFFNSGGSVAPGVTNLRSILNMNDLGEYGRDPSEPLPGFLNATSGVGVLCQEAGHMVGAFVTANNADILGRSNAHWSFFFETYGSSLEGNGWQNNGGNSYTTIASNRHMSQLDNYLWGFLLPTAITDPMYVLNNPVPNLVTTQNGDSSLPTEGVTVTASTITTVTIGNITSVHGARNPTATSSQKAYKMAWILVIPAGTSAIPADLEKIDDFRTQWEEDFFPAETNGVGSMSSELTAANITVDFEARVLEGEVGLTVEFDNDSFGSITGFLWDFGDGDTSTERHPTHSYDKFGPFDVSLTVTGTGGPTTVTKTEYIRVGPSTKHFSDDFETDLGWTVEAGGTALTGIWLRANPVGTFLESTFGNDNISAEVQAENDHTPAAGVQCLVTGNALAGEGVRFDQAVCPTPFCSPTRASIITGLYPHAHGIVTNIGRRDYPAIKSPPTQEGIQRRDVTTGKLLFAAGYATHHFGKWHLMDEDLPYYTDMYGEHHEYAAEMADVFTATRQRDPATWMDWYGWILPVEQSPQFLHAVGQLNDRWSGRGYAPFITKMGRLTLPLAQNFDVRVADKTVERIAAADALHSLFL